MATGLREGELVALTWNDIDFDNAALRVNKTACWLKDCYTNNGINQKYHIEIGTPKTKSSNRTVPLLPSVVEMLKRLRIQQKERLLQKGKEYECKNKYNLIFLSYKKGEYVYFSRMYARFKAMLKKADINPEGLNIHSLRHTFATRGLENGIELKVPWTF